MFEDFTDEEIQDIEGLKESAPFWIVVTSFVIILAALIYGFIQICKLLLLAFQI